MKSLLDVLGKLSTAKLEAQASFDLMVQSELAHDFASQKEMFSETDYDARLKVIDDLKNNIKQVVAQTQSLAAILKPPGHMATEAEPTRGLQVMLVWQEFSVASVSPFEQGSSGQWIRDDLDT